MTFSNNTAEHGGAVYFEGDRQKVIFQKNTNVTSIYNKAIEGGALYLLSLVSYLQELLLLNFALLGVGAISSLENSNIWFTGEATIYFNKNLARQHGGAILVLLFSQAIHVRRDSGGGALYSYDHCNFTIRQHAVVTFDKNSAKQCRGHYMLKVVKLLMLTAFNS